MVGGDEIVCQLSDGGKADVAEWLQHEEVLFFEKGHFLLLS
jgi:hypothetical protein